MTTLDSKIYIAGWLYRQSLYVRRPCVFVYACVPFSMAYLGISRTGSDAFLLAVIYYCVRLMVMLTHLDRPCLLGLVFWRPNYMYEGNARVVDSRLVFLPVSELFVNTSFGGLGGHSCVVQK